MSGAVPPHDLDAEESILGAALLAPAARDTLLELVDQADYYRESHSLVHRAIARLTAKGDPVDAISVADTIEGHSTPDERSAYDRTGGRPYVFGLADSVIGAAAATRHQCMIVRRHAQSRAAISACLEAIQAAHSGDDPDDVLAQHTKRIAEISAGRGDRGLFTIGQVADEWVEETLNDLATGGMRTGWPTIDAELTTPIKRGEVVSVAARSGVGKTYALLDLACHAIQNQPTSGAIFVSLEMPRTDILERIAGQTLNLATPALRKLVGDGARDVGDAIVSAADYLERFVIWDAGATASDLPTIIAKARRAGIDPAVVCVDYLGLLKWDGAASASTYERVSETVRSLKGIARQERVVLMNAVQLNRNAASGGTRPTMDMIRDSGAIEESSDRIIALWAPAREPGLNPDKARELRDVVKACLLKNRKGVVGSDAVLTFTRGRRLVETISEGAAA